MAGGGNNKPSGNNATQQHSNHKGDRSLSATSTSSQQSLLSRVMGNKSFSNSNDPKKGGSAVFQCSGTVGSFNNYGKGSQDFSYAKINSGKNSDHLNGAVSSGEKRSSETETGTGTISSFNCYEKGSQNFTHAKINSGGNSEDI